MRALCSYPTLCTIKQPTNNPPEGLVWFEEVGELTVNGEAGGGALGAIGEGAELAGVAGLVLGPQPQQGEVAVAQAGTQDDAALKGLVHAGLGVAASVPGHGGGLGLLSRLGTPAPQHLVHLPREAVVAGEGEPLSTHSRLVAVPMHPT